LPIWSGRNPNVFYEVGYAHAKNKLCVLLTKSAQDIPFDLKHHRHIVYTSVLDLKAKLLQDLKSIKDEISARILPFSVSLNSISGDLQKTNFEATAAVEISLDMQNPTKHTSPEIEAIYFYTGEGWIFRQDLQECQGADSDLAGYKRRHFIKSPVQRLSKEGGGTDKTLRSKNRWNRVEKGRDFKRQL
jgi:hypothetical protein